MEYLINEYSLTRLIATAGAHEMSCFQPSLLSSEFINQEFLNNKPKRVIYLIFNFLSNCTVFLSQLHFQRQLV